MKAGLNQSHYTQGIKAGSDFFFLFSIVSRGLPRLWPHQFKSVRSDTAWGPRRSCRRWLGSRRWRWNRCRLRRRSGLGSGAGRGTVRWRGFWRGRGRLRGGTSSSVGHSRQFLLSFFLLFQLQSMSCLQAASPLSPGLPERPWLPGATISSEPDRPLVVRENVTDACWFACFLPVSYRQFMERNIAGQCY